MHKQTAHTINNTAHLTISHITDAYFISSACFTLEIQWKHTLKKYYL